jgi:hypothetical protein
MSTEKKLERDKRNTTRPSHASTAAAESVRVKKNRDETTCAGASHRWLNRRFAEAEEGAGEDQGHRDAQPHAK